MTTSKEPSNRTRSAQSHGHGVQSLAFVFALALGSAACGDDTGGCPHGFARAGDHCVVEDVVEDAGADTGIDAQDGGRAPDMGVVADSGADAPGDAGDDAGPCGVECSGERRLCNVLTMMCVECLAAEDCESLTDACEEGVCVGYRDSSGHSGTRLRRTYLEADGAYMTNNFLWDNELETYCEYTRAVDGTMRCLPYLRPQTEGIYFPTSSCTQPMVKRGCAFEEYVERSRAGGRERLRITTEVISVPDLGMWYLDRDDRCVRGSLSGGPYRALSPVPSTAFVRGVERQEPRAGGLVARFMVGDDGSELMLRQYDTRDGTNRLLGPRPRGCTADSFDGRLEHFGDGRVQVTRWVDEEGAQVAPAFAFWDSAIDRRCNVAQIDGLLLCVPFETSNATQFFANDDCMGGRLSSRAFRCDLGDYTFQVASTCFGDRIPGTLPLEGLYERGSRYDGGDAYRFRSRDHCGALDVSDREYYTRGERLDAEATLPALLFGVE